MGPLQCLVLWEVEQADVACCRDVMRTRSWLARWRAWRPFKRRSGQTKLPRADQSEALAMMGNRPVNRDEKPSSEWDGRGSCGARGDGVKFWDADSTALGCCRKKGEAEARHPIVQGKGENVIRDEGRGKETVLDQAIWQGRHEMI